MPLLQQQEPEGLEAVFLARMTVFSWHSRNEMSTQMPSRAGVGAGDGAVQFRLIQASECVVSKMIHVRGRCCRLPK